MTEAEYFGEGSTVNIGRKKEIFKKGQKFKVTFSLLDYVFVKYLLRLIVLKCSFTLLSILTVFVMMLLSTKCIANEVKVNENLVYASVQAALWLCEDYPLSLQEQIMPIVDLLAISNTHFQERERKTLHNIEKCMIAYDRCCCLSTFLECILDIDIITRLPCRKTAE